MEADPTLDGGLAASLVLLPPQVYLFDVHCSIGLEAEVWNETHQAKQFQQGIGVSHG